MAAANVQPLIPQSSASLMPLPTSLQEKVAIDRIGKSVYVERRSSSDPQLLTWIERNRSIGIVMHIKPCDVDEIAKLRANGMRAGADQDEDLDVRNHAMEIICTAAKYKASDVHIMMRGNYAEIQIVIKGGLRVLKRLTQEEGNGIARAIYQGIAKTRDSSYNPLEFQNAQIPGDALPPETGLSSVRIVRGPSYPQSMEGAFMTMRLQYVTGKSPAHSGELAALQLPRQPAGELCLPNMGYTPVQVERLRMLMGAPNGLVIFTGPTGSGKTTAMFEVLKELARVKPQKRQVTVEDPVEYPMEWAVQMAVTGARNDKETGEAFGERVRVALRMAPNTILLGEVRGPEVAVAALEASVTGHQVWSTLHVSDPYLFVERLELMDRERLDRRVFCDHKIVRGVVAQRLLPKLCPHCSKPLAEAHAAIPKRILHALRTWGDLTRVRVKGDGCVRCGHDGELGRFAVAEVVVMDASIMSDFIQHGSDVARRNHRAKPGADPSMLVAAIGHVLNGVVDPRSVEDCVDSIEERGKDR